MSTLRQLVSRRAGISAEQAELAIGAVMQYLASRLASPLMGQVCVLLKPGEDAEGGPGEERESR